MHRTHRLVPGLPLSWVGEKHVAEQAFVSWQVQRLLLLQTKRPVALLGIIKSEIRRCLGDLIPGKGRVRQAHADVDLLARKDTLFTCNFEQLLSNGSI